MKYIPNICDHCGQTRDYALALDKGSALIVQAISVAISWKHENRVHLEKELVQDADGRSNENMAYLGLLTPRMEGNASRPRFHGLIASVADSPGEFLLTPKGAAFLKDAKVPRVALIDKATHTKICYLDEEHDLVNYSYLVHRAPMWDGALEQFFPSPTEQPTLAFPFPINHATHSAEGRSVA